MRHLLWMFLCLAFCLPVTSAPAIPGLPETVNGGKPVTIVVERLFPIDKARDVPGKAEAAILKAFQERYPNVTLQPFTYTDASGHNAEPFDEKALQAAMNEGKGPDVMTVYFRQSGSYIRDGFLRPLDTQIDQWRQTPDGEKEFQYFYPEALRPICYRSGPDLLMHWYTVPTHSRLALVLFIQKKCCVQRESTRSTRRKIGANSTINASRSVIHVRRRISGRIVCTIVGV